MAEKDFSYPLKVGTILRGGTNAYKVEEVLGQGGFGITYRVSANVAYDKIIIENATFAIKEHFIKGICERGADGMEVKYARPAEEEYKGSLEGFIKEGKSINQICQVNPNIVNVNEVFEANNTAYYVMEYLKGGDLRQMVKQNGKGLTEEEALSIICPIAHAVDCLHKERLLHLDIKPENIVMRRSIGELSNEPVLIDFGISMHFDTKGKATTRSRSTGFSEGYSPREQFAPISTFAPTIDIYALGATCLYVLTGKDPIGAFDVSKGYLEKVLPSSVSVRTKDAIIQAMDVEWKNRPQSIGEFLNNLVVAPTIKNGSILKGGHFTYRIIATEKEFPQGYVYKAVRDFGAKSMGGASGTRTDHYSVYEFYVRDDTNVKRDINGVLSGLQLKDAHKVAYEDFCKFVKANSGLVELGELNMSGSKMNCEFFMSNGTFYLVKRDKWSSSLPSPNNIFSSKSIKVLAILVVLLTMICLGIYFYPKLSSGSSRDVRDRIEIERTDSATLEPRQGANGGTEVNEPSQVVPSATVEEVTPTKEHSNPSSTTDVPQKTEVAKEEQVVKIGTLNLSNAVWNGGIKNGKPDGKGSLRIKYAQSFYGEPVGEGYRIDAVYDDGSFIQGVVYDAQGEKISIIVP